MTIEERQEAAKWFQNRAIHTTIPGAKMMFKRAAEALSEGIQPQRQPPTEDDYAYCAECNSVEMCRWYPLYGCQFRSLPSAQTHWIPCSVGLPKENGEYFVTDHKGDVARYVFRNTEEGQEYWRRCVKAWMPLPKPYGGESDV